MGKNIKLLKLSIRGGWKEIGARLVSKSNIDATTQKDEYGFSAIMAGMHVPHGHHRNAPHCFDFFHNCGFWYSQKDSTEEYNSWEITLSDSTLRQSFNVSEGFTIRCIKD